jgi:hypothetical protein
MHIKGLINKLAAQQLFIHLGGRKGEEGRGTSKVRLLHISRATAQARAIINDTYLAYIIVP